MLATRVAKGIISEEQAQDYCWLDESCKSNGFLERYNNHHKFLLGQDGGERFVAFENEILPKFLVGANLEDANLRSANLAGADLTGANLAKANLTRC